MPGESAQMTATRKSESYDYLVPVTAVWQENNKAYVLLLETENTVLRRAVYREEGGSADFR